MSKTRTFTVRGFNVTAAPFNCQGEMSAVQGAVEITDVPTEARAVELLLTHPDISSMTAKTPSTAALIDTLAIKADAYISSATDAKALRKELMPIIKTWAEKSRIRGCRGWRAHALRAPKVAKRKDGSYEVDFKAVFGHAVYYNDRVVSVGHTDDMAYISETLADLRKQVDRMLPGKIGGITVEHEATRQTTAV